MKIIYISLANRLHYFRKKIQSKLVMGKFGFTRVRESEFFNYKSGHRILYYFTRFIITIKQFFFFNTQKKNRVHTI